MEVSEKKYNKFFIPEIIDNKFKILKRIGSGSFGIVYKGVDIKTDEFVAIKVETNTKAPRLEYEKKLYRLLSNHKGIPQIKWNGIINEKSVLVMDYLGPTLDDLYKFCDSEFSLKTVGMIALQILDRVEFIHNHNILHRDIKPDNFLIGSGKKKNRIYIIDFGLSKKYRTESKHNEYKKGKSFSGSFRYSSIRNHKGIEQSRRDDLESIGYMLIYFLKKKLPWQGLKGSTKSKRSKSIFKVKRNTSLEVLCEGLPRELYYYMKYCRLLRFKQDPDYTYLKSLFINIFKENSYTYDNIFDWNIVAKIKRDKKRTQLELSKIKITETNR